MDPERTDAPTATDDAPADAERLQDLPLPALRSLAADEATSITVTAAAPDRVELTVSSSTGKPGLTVEVDLADAVGFWSPDAQHRLLAPDWAGPAATSLVASTPVGALYNAAGEVLLGWAASEAVAELEVRCGVSEERKTFVVGVRPTTELAADLGVVLDTGRAPLARVLSGLAGWVSAHGAGQPLPVPAVARRPVYSTWYTFAQDLDADVVTQEAGLAAQLGCGSVFIDDGWQRLGHGRGYRGCGDWVPDTVKFPDLTRTVRAIRDGGCAVALWIAPLLLGAQSDAHARLAAYAPQHVAGLDCFVLDPRQPAVREHLADTCLRLVEDYGVQLLKVDFLEQAMVYRGTPTSGDLADVGEAMQRLLQQLRERLDHAGHGEVTFEFRQPYVSPAIARFGQILRAGDCPADSVVNRRSVVDARLLSVGQVVHADPMMWGRQGGVEAVAQQLYGGWFGVPQISMRLADLDPGQADAVHGLLGLWREHADVILDGTLSTQAPEHGHQLVRVVHPDLGRAVVAAYAPLVVDLDEVAEGVPETLLLNATSTARLVVRTARPVTGGVVRSAAGRALGPVAPAAAGLLDLAVPAFGSVTLETGSDR